MREMWRDILIILAFALATLNYFGITPRKISGYTRNAKAEVAKRARHQKIVLFLGIAVSLAVIFVIVSRVQDLTLEIAFLFIVLFSLMWCSIFSDAWKLSKKGEKIVDIVTAFIMLPALIGLVILFDMPLWQKISLSVGGVCIGFSVALLSRYIDKKLERRRSSKG
jgi:hypothetical protein